MIKESGSQRQTAVIAEIKNGFSKLNSLDREEINRQTRMSMVNRNSNLTEFKLEINGSKEHEQDVFAEIITTEVSSWKNVLLNDYMKIAEKAEKEIQNVGNEKSKLQVEKEILEKNYMKLQNEAKNVLDLNRKHEKDLEYLIREYEMQSKEMAEIKVLLEESKNRHIGIERSLKYQLENKTKEYEDKISDLSESNYKLKTENDFLVNQKNKMVNVTANNEQLVLFQDDKIASMNVQMSKMKIESDQMRAKSNKLINDYTIALEEINQLKDQITKLKIEHRDDIEKVSMDYELKIKQIESIQTGILTGQAKQSTSSNFMGLNFEDDDFNYQPVHVGRDSDLNGNPYIQNRETGLSTSRSTNVNNGRQTTTKRETTLNEKLMDIREKSTSFVNRRITELNSRTTANSIVLNKNTSDIGNMIFSKKHIEPIVEVYMEDDGFGEASMSDLSQIKLLEEKDNEIAKLNKQIIDLQQNSKTVDQSKFKETISRLELEVKQLKEKVQMMKENEEKIIRDNQKYTSLIIQERISAVQTLTIEVSEKENEMIMMKKKINNLNLAVSEYERMVAEFNKKKRR